MRHAFVCHQRLWSYGITNVYETKKACRITFGNLFYVALCIQVRHLKYEADVDVTKARTDTDSVISANHSDYRSAVDRAEQAKVAALDALEDQNEVAHDSLAHLQGQHAAELSRTTATHADALTTYQATCAARLKLLRENLDVQQRVELSEIEDRKNKHLQTLMENHKVAFAEMKDYYQGITADNCGLIKRYEEELAELRANQLKNAELLKAATDENERLRAPLAVVMAEVAQLRSKLSGVDKVKLMLSNARGRLKDNGRRRDSSKQAVLRLEQRLSQAAAKKEALYREFETSILDLQARTDRKNLMLAKRLDGYEAEAEGSEARIEQMVASMDLPKPQVLEVLHNTSAAVRDTQEALDRAKFGIARGVKVYNETLAAFQAKMIALEVPEAEAKGFGFGPLPDPKGGARTQPSGMVATPFNPAQTRAVGGGGFGAGGKENSGLQQQSNGGGGFGSSASTVGTSAF